MGKDRKGNNLGRYTDGSAFCFSCGYTERRTLYRQSAPRKKSIPDFHELSQESRDYLSRYLTAQEIETYFKGCKYGHVFHCLHPDGSVYWEARSVNPKRVMSGGSKPFLILGQGMPVVVVEDLISAIVVSRVTSAMPLFGSHLSNETMARLSKVATEVVIWLDPDKKAESLYFRNKLSSLVTTRCVFTTHDPKDEKDVKNAISVR